MLDVAILASYKGFDATACPVSALGWSQCQKVAELLGLPRYRGSGIGIPEYRLMVKQAKDDINTRHSGHRPETGKVVAR